MGSLIPGARRPDGDGESSRRAAVWVLICVAAAPLLCRALLTTSVAPSVTWGDARGVLLDAATTLVAFAIVVLLGRVTRWLSLAAVGVWIAANFANLETVRALGSMALALDLPYLVDPTFVAGSAVALAHPYWLGLCVLVTFWGVHRRVRSVPLSQVVVAATVGTSIYLASEMWPADEDVPLWRQTHFLALNIDYLRSEGAGDAGVERFADPASAMFDLLPGMRANLSGALRWDFERRDRNVLLVVVESVSGAYIETLAQRHDRGAIHPLRRLDALATDAASYSTFISHQRKTNRGMYALLCGELPNLLPGVPKMTEHVAGGWQRCLPEVLAERGYQTAFRQGAPLAFMLKGPFMRNVGFDRVEGSASFGTAHVENQWGVDDRTFFEGALQTVEELDSRGSPWFITLLTVGTHHPYLVPDAYLPSSENARARAMQYADLALGEFIEGLEERGLLDETLLVITSDESAGAEPDSERAAVMFENWGFLILRGPGIESVVVDEIFTQMDVPLTILDYLGAGEVGDHFAGRSALRSYVPAGNSPGAGVDGAAGGGRWVFFANTNHLLVGAIDPHRNVILCNQAANHCTKHEPHRGRVFHRLRYRLPWEEGSDGIVKEMAQRSVATGSPHADARVYRETAEPSMRVPVAGRQMLQGGQYLSLNPDEWIEVTLELTVERADAPVLIEHYIRGTHSWSEVRRRDGALPLLRKLTEVAEGQALMLQYRVARSEFIEGLQARTYVLNRGQEEAQLRVRRAEMRVSRGDGRPTTPVELDRYDLTPPNGGGRLDAEGPQFVAEPG